MLLILFRALCRTASPAVGVSLGNGDVSEGETGFAGSPSGSLHQHLPTPCRGAGQGRNGKLGCSEKSSECLIKQKTKAPVHVAFLT